MCPMFLIIVVLDCFIAAHRVGSLPGFGGCYVKVLGEDLVCSFVAR
jgi:hypothetical protein